MSEKFIITQSRTGPNAHSTWFAVAALLLLTVVMLVAVAALNSPSQTGKPSKRPASTPTQAVWAAPAS